ncbi:MAG TPA: ASKHA domain-containing protein [Anaerolineae bacterium]|nr:ASKHA domain-containing protein [Anaerolineae bacterium]
MSTLTVKYYIEVPVASLDNNRGDIDRINKGLMDRYGAEEVRWSLDCIITAANVLRQSGGRITVTGSADGGYLNVISVEPGDTNGSHFGVAIDLGTTIVAAELIDLNTGGRLAAEGEVNDQVRYGEDLLTRLHFAGKGGTDTLRRALIGTVNRLIAKVCTTSGIASSQISAICTAGNTSMTHLLLGLDPSPMRREPYIPVLNHVPRLSARELGLSALPDAVIYVFPSAGSFLGGDLIAGALASGIAEQREISLLLDIGTNGEMILGNDEWLLAGAGAAGPALEGGVAECARRAEPGAIDRVIIDPVTLEPSCSVIGDVPPRGLCGSGLIDVMAQLFVNGLLDPTGRFITDKKIDRWRVINGRMAYILAEASGADSIPVTYITEKDIQNVLRTKAAMVAALTILLDSVGLSIGDIQRVYTAGSFGVHLAVDSATAIGLYPRIPADRFIPLGNGSLSGAREVLLDARKIDKARQITDTVTYLELNVHPRFMEIFRSAKYM